MKKRNIFIIVGVIILLLIIGIIFFINKYFADDNPGDFKGPYEENMKVCSELNEDECMLSEKCFWYENCDYDSQSISEEDCIAVNGNWQTGQGITACLLSTQEQCEGLGYSWNAECDFKELPT